MSDFDLNKLQVMAKHFCKLIEEKANPEIKSTVELLNKTLVDLEKAIALDQDSSISEYNLLIDDINSLQGHYESLQTKYNDLSDTHNEYTQTYPKHLASKLKKKSERVDFLESNWVSPKVHNNVVTELEKLQKIINGQRRTQVVENIQGKDGLRCDLRRTQTNKSYLVKDSNFSFLTLEWNYEILTNFGINICCLVNEYFRPHFPHCTELQDAWPDEFSDKISTFFEEELKQYFPVHYERVILAKETSIENAKRLSQEEKELLVSAGFRNVYEIVSSSDSFLARTIKGADHRQLELIRHKLNRDLPKPRGHVMAKSFIVR